MPSNDSFFDTVKLCHELISALGLTLGGHLEKCQSSTTADTHQQFTARMGGIRRTSFDRSKYSPNHEIPLPRLLTPPRPMFHSAGTT